MSISNETYRAAHVAACDRSVRDLDAGRPVSEVLRRHRAALVKRLTGDVVIGMLQGLVAWEREGAVDDTAEGRDVLRQVFTGFSADRGGRADQ